MIAVKMPFKSGRLPCSSVERTKELLTKFQVLIRTSRKSCGPRSDFV